MSMNEEVVVIESGKGRSKFDLLDAALEEVQFLNLIEEEHRRIGRSKEEFVILIKPNLAMFFKDVATITDPLLVEYLVDQLHDRGYSNVLLGEAQNVFGRWLENREIKEIAEAAGYRFLTPKGRKYNFIDLAEVEDEIRTTAEYSISEIPISKSWVDADFRINFAKNKTHEQYSYTLCLKNLLGALPLWDKHLNYHSRLKVFDVCLELNQRYPVHFNIIDAYVSNHGNAGAQVANPIKTQTIIAGVDTILVDWVGAIKMGLDPYLSPLNKKALDLIGLPDQYQVIGNLDAYKGWRNVHPLIADSLLRLDEAEAVRRIFWPGSFTNDRRLFRWKKKRYEWVNRLMSPFWGRTDKNPLFRWFFILFNYSLVLVYFINRVLKAVIFKKRLMIKELPINLPEDKFRDEDYEKLPETMRPFEELVQALPRNSRSCHTFVDDAILYCLERDVDCAFDEFVAKFDICRAITTMKDYVGGRTVQKKFDNGRCIHQLERTVFLPQPNLFALLNGPDVDVTKIEKIEYGKRFQKLIWKTVLSDNHTGVYDNGTVTFEQHNCRTRIRVMAYQKFLYPWALRWVRMDLWPALRRFIVLRIYRGFFEKTIDNYCAVAEGKYKPIGRTWKETYERR
jgi:uncharacterized protein (DUF362 family)